jgi:hypothetical protein
MRVEKARMPHHRFFSFFFVFIDIIEKRLQNEQKSDILKSFEIP